MLKEGWRWLTVGDVTVNHDGKRRPVKGLERVAGAYPYYGASGIVDHVEGYLFDGLHLLVAEDGENLRTRNTPVAFLADGKFWVNNHAHIVTGNALADTRFLAYALESSNVEPFLTGSTQPKLTQGNLNRIPVLTPPLSEQLLIAAVLGSLDDKIELNRRMNETLEAMARALFRSWFVDFDPVRAKSEGRPTGLPADLDALFPNEFEDSILGEIPKGWSVRPLDEIADFLNGLALQKFPAVQGEPWLPVIKIAQLRKGITSDCDRASFGVPPNYIIQNGDLLFSWSGSLEVQVWTHGQGALNQHLFKVTSKEFRQWFVYQWLMEHLTHFRHVAASKATTMGHIQRSHLTGALCVVPDERVLSAANDQVGPLHAQVVQNSLEAGRLASTRDELLPKLLSGEIEVAGEEVTVA